MPLSFLIVEDDRAQQKLLSNVVMMLGAQSQFANNGVDALRLVEDASFDIILMDIEMPLLGGIATADRLLSRWSSQVARPRILAVSGKASPDQVNLCRAVGIDGFVAKPYALSVLRSALQSIVLHGYSWRDGQSRRLFDLQVFEKSLLKDDQQWFKSGSQIRETLLAEETAESRATIGQYAAEHGFVKLHQAATDLELKADLKAELADFDRAFAAAQQWEEESRSLKAAA